MENGIARLHNGRAIIENSLLVNVQANGISLVIGESGSDVILRNISIKNCVEGLDAFVSSKAGSNLNITGKSLFEETLTESKNGGCINNRAFEAKDLFVSCRKLNDSVITSRFAFEYKNEGYEVDMKGKDRDYFDESVDLRMFLMERKAEEVYVANEGHDIAGCGSKRYPCHAM
ncbi:uncharacterized protein MONOS_6957c2 [Monocercomonoides exilis]|uniref:uncharacterized protein n=1 Tax=Monocercomonoides exilis TaxID=2049356 RepID=UPI003559544E|nr:hypothetical protein MONOS_6957c1 [Monocercomonoides exilis]KAH7825239.1 hypothetical protein MONOS_6957c2 [Monocercomonoides exilis]|eukprot:MONOS_6957.1-p1 / transcript=MONOS_6957.1 / gene=MONOS_6957 / organism=Monocercomonoides_exilis_PA203 / gene_product=unspecified product / transcript_product=unspecified product / location=Mono_scaffold00229:6976-7653(-) / protein_length=174 / sequence_SO=supercontig / SO=protein_coding / is_pseudo=false